jgi:4-amino-4-deoxy-L-arabinose transferase-like glycosyltransferase
MDPDEGRYAEIAREMWVLKDWLIPHLNFLPYLEKPPLVYWLTGLSFGALGFTELAARLPSALSALGGVFLAYYLGRAWWGPGAGFLSAVILASCGGYVALGRLITLDMTFALLMNLGVGLGYLALSRERPRLWVWAYLALSLAVLTKGPVAVVLAGLIWFLWALIHPHPNPPPSRGRENEDDPHPNPPPSRGRENEDDPHLNTLPSRGGESEEDPHPNTLPSKGRQQGEGASSGFSNSPPPQGSPFKGEGVKGSVYWRLRRLYQPRGWLLLVALSLPWFFYVTWRYPEFFRFFVLEQHLGRYLTAAIHHHEPFYYYGPVLLGLMLPWSWLLPWALGRERPGADPDRLFCLIWAGVVLIFFTLSRGKLAPYVLPALLPLALLMGRSLTRLNVMGWRFSGARGLSLSLGLWALTGWAVFILYMWPPSFLIAPLARTAGLGPSLPALLFLLALTPTVTLMGRHLGLLLLGALIMSVPVSRGMENLSLIRSPRELGRAVQALWQPGAALMGVGHYSQGINFYSGQAMHLLKDSRTELDFGRKLRPESGLFFSGTEDMVASAASRPLTFFLLKETALPYFKQRLPGKFRFLGRYKNSILVAYEGN